jgi:hypothetical protein
MHHRHHPHHHHQDCHHQCHGQAPQFHHDRLAHECNPGMTSLLGGAISVGNALIWGGAHMARRIVSEALWGDCDHGYSHCGGHHGHNGCAPRTLHEYYFQCSPTRYEHHCC